MRNLPAFPRPASEYTASGTLPDGNDAEPAQKGMTLLDYFAAKAMQGDWADAPPRRAATDEELDTAAQHYYRMAQAMLRVRPSF